MLRRTLVLAFLLIIPSVVLAQKAAPPPLKVLFVGNSYTAVNDLPSMVMGLAEAAGGRKIDADRHLVGGCTLERHVKETGAIAKIREQKWDVVVLQEQSLRPVVDRDLMFQYARILHAEIEKQGAKTVFYLTWARQHIPDMQEGANPAESPEYAKAMFQISGAAKTSDFEAWCRQHGPGLEGGLNGAYCDIAEELGAGVAPVGPAWKKALAANPPFVLHRSDKSHPTPTGTYLAACVFYATLLDKSPVGLPGEVKKGDKALLSIPANDARRLQEIAWDTVRNVRQESQLDSIQVSQDGTAFVFEKSGRKFVPWGFNYDHDEAGRLIEDYWDEDWAKIEEDFREMKRLGATVIRVHLQFGKFMDASDKANDHSLRQLARLVKLAEEVRLYLDLTGLGCYHKQDVPPWYDKLEEQDRWAAQAAFWTAVAKTCAESPAIFCYDLMNEPVVAGGAKKRDDWLGPAFGDKHFVQFITLEAKGRPRAEIARQWIDRLVAAIRKHDQRHLVTVGLVPWSLDRPGMSSGFIPEKVAGKLDFIAMHLYPEAGKVAEAMETLRGFAVGKPVVIEETFPLKCSPDEMEQFIDESQSVASGWISFYWGKTAEEYRKGGTIGDAIMANWLECFPQECRSIQARNSEAPPFLHNGVTAHRGNSSEYPENTMPAFESGIQVGADWIELDIYRTKDGKLVVIHDQTTERVGDRNLTVKDSTYTELLTVDVATGFRQSHGESIESCPPERIPLLEDVLRLVMGQHRTRVSIQPKMDCVAEAVALVKAMKAERWVGFNDGSLDFMSQVKRLAPEIPVFWDRAGNTDVDDDVRIATSHGFNSLVLHQSGVTPEKIQKIKAAGLEAGAWTVDDRATMETFLDMGVERLYTDHPRQLLALKASRTGGRSSDASPSCEEDMSSASRVTPAGDEK